MFKWGMWVMKELSNRYYPNYEVGDHLISNVALDYSSFPAGFYVKCLRCGKIMINHHILKEECKKEIK